MIFDLPNIIDGDMKKSMTEHTNELIKKHEELPRKQESGTMAKWHSTGWERSGDLDLYICCLQRITALFFTFNHQNYSRWLTVITTSYLNLRIMIPTFMKSSRRVASHSNEHHFISIDLTLEQTINADAVCQHSGLILLTNSISARQYWAQSHSICTSILSKFFEELGMTSTEDISEELKPHQLKQNCHHLIIPSINDATNLIASTIEKEHLFNIANGKAALDEMVDFLNNAWTIGFSARECFIKDCNDVQTPTRTQSSNKRSRFCFWSW